MKIVIVTQLALHRCPLFHKGGGTTVNWCVMHGTKSHDNMPHGTILVYCISPRYWTKAMNLGALLDGFPLIAVIPQWIIHYLHVLKSLSVSLMVLVLGLQQARISYCLKWLKWTLLSRQVCLILQLTKTINLWSTIPSIAWFLDPSKDPHTMQRIIKVEASIVDQVHLTT